MARAATQTAACSGATVLLVMAKAPTILPLLVRGQGCNQCVHKAKQDLSRWDPEIKIKQKIFKLEK